MDNCHQIHYYIEYYFKTVFTNRYSGVARSRKVNLYKDTPNDNTKDTPNDIILNSYYPYIEHFSSTPITSKNLRLKAIVLFSGREKCRAFTKQWQKDNTDRNISDDALEAMISLGNEMKSSGRKRGANLKMKRALKEECNEATKSKPTVSKTSKLKELKIKEMMAFAGLSDANPSESPEMGTKTPTKITDHDPRKERVTPKRTPAKSPTRSSHNSETPPRREQTPSSCKKTQPSPKKRQLTPTKTPTKRRRIEPSPKRKETASKRQTDVGNAPKTPSEDLQTLQTHEKTPEKGRQTQKAKTPKKQMKDVGNAPKSQNEDLQTLQTHKKTPEKGRQTQKAKTTKQRVEESPVHSKARKSPNKRTQEVTPKELQSSPFQDISSLVGSSLDLLNEGSEVRTLNKQVEKLINLRHILCRLTKAWQPKL